MFEPILRKISFLINYIILKLCYSSLKFLTITDLGTIEFVNDLNYIVSAGISARDVYSTFRAERRAVVTPEPRAPWRRVPTGSARGEHCVTPARAAEKETRGAPGWGGGGDPFGFQVTGMIDGSCGV